MEVTKDMTALNERINTFETLLHSVNLMDGAVQWLRQNKFFTSPASTKFHGAYEGGLFEHSLNVAVALEYLTERLSLVWSRQESPLIIGMFHDVCKTDLYIYNPILDRFEWNPDSKPGHGDKSVKLINEHLISLTKEEEACIRWHMGAFDDKTNWSHYTDSIKEYPNVLYTHTADMLATHVIETQSNK